MCERDDDQNPYQTPGQRSDVVVQEPHLRLARCARRLALWGGVLCVLMSLPLFVFVMDVIATARPFRDDASYSIFKMRLGNGCGYMFLTGSCLLFVACLLWIFGPREPSNWKSVESAKARRDKKRGQGVPG